MGGLFVEKIKICRCHAPNHPRDEQGVNGKLNEVTSVTHTLFSVILHSSYIAPIPEWRTGRFLLRGTTARALNGPPAIHGQHRRGGAQP